MTRSLFTCVGDTADHRSRGATERLLKAIDALAEADGLDSVTQPLRRIIRALPLGRARDVLHGLPLGHPLHPALVQIPIGAWTCAAVLDLTPGARRPAHLLVALGVITAVPAAWCGWVDWAEQHEQQMRTGLVHALGVGAAIALYGGSWAARGRGHHGLGRVLGFTGAAAATAGAYLGGHVAYRQGAGTNKTEPVAHLVGPGWHPLGRLADLQVGLPVRRTIGDVPLLVVRESEDTVHVLAARCSHMAGPLTEGEVVDGCVRCPWHGSLFRLTDGWNVGGPATAPQPRFETRTDGDGVLHVRLPEAG
ncbi:MULTISPECIES: Rieske 2Fe-2S domain-containing protein [unclassified Kitasatospora]